MQGVVSGHASVRAKKMRTEALASVRTKNLRRGLVG